jgi:GAF domain-containing protein
MPGWFAVVEEDRLATSVAHLSELVAADQPIAEMLVHIAQYAVHAIAGADGAGLTMLEANRPQTVVASAEFVQQVDDAQYSIGQGPCLLAVATGQTQTSASLGGDARWPRFGPRVGRLGVHSALSLPLLLQDRVVGALNVYAHERDAFSPDAVRSGELFAKPASVAVHNAQVLSQYQRLSAQLGEALTSRATIDQALGIIMSRTGADAEDAFGRLREMSQTQNVKISDLSHTIVGEAVRRARSRNQQDPPAAASLSS